MKVANLEGQALNFWVARADVNITLHTMDGKPYVLDDKPGLIPYEPSTDWAQGGPIIERERIDLRDYDGVMWWAAFPDLKKRCHVASAYGRTPLIAAMRCYVAAKFGEEVPDAEKVGDGPWVSTTDAFTKPPFVKPRIMGEIVAEVFNRAFEKDEKDKKP